MTRGGRDELLSDVVRLWRVRAGQRSRSCLSVSRGHGWLVGQLSGGEGEGGGGSRKEIGTSVCPGNESSETYCKSVSP